MGNIASVRNVASAGTYPASQALVTAYDKAAIIQPRETSRISVRAASPFSGTATVTVTREQAIAMLPLLLEDSTITDVSVEFRK